jgi:hypothetical protein
MSLLNMLRALRYGAELTNAEVWKTRATAIAALTGLLSAVTGFAAAQGWLEAIDPQTIMEVSSALVTIVSAVLAYFQVATSGRVGVGKGRFSEVEPGEPPFPDVLESTAMPEAQRQARPDVRRPEPEPDRLLDATRRAGPTSVSPAPERVDERPGQRADDNPFLFS